MIRRLDPLEKLFFNPASQNDIYFSLKFTSKKYVEQATQNFVKIFSGLRLKVVNDCYYRRDIETPVKKLPNWIQDCKMASKWAEDHIYEPFSEGLANIATNDRIIVVRSSHNLSDGGFLLEAVKHIFDDMSDQPKVTEPPYTMKEAFTQEIDDAVNHYKAHPNSKPDLELTTCKYDSDNPFLAPVGTRKVETDYVIPSHELCCYDKKSKKPKALSESQFASLAFAISALRKDDPKDYKPLVITVIADARRFMYDKNRIDWRFGQCFSSPLAGAVPQKGDTVNDIIMKTRASIKKQDAFSIFYDLLSFDSFLKPRPNTIIPCISSIGPINFKRPIVDIDLRNFHTTKLGLGDHGKSAGTMWSFISYSKVNETKNDLHLFFLNNPADTTLETDTVLRKSILHFLTKIPLDTKYEDALLEIERFQEQVRKDF